MRVALLAFAVLAVGLTQAQPAPVSGRDIVSAAVGGYIEPAYEALHERTGEMQRAMVALCTRPAQNELDAAKGGFGRLVDAWAAAEIIRFGPIAQENRLERFLYWPDRKGIGLKQVQAALASADPSATDVAGLAGKSVAMQGLGALEFVLNGSGAQALSGAAGSYRCAYGRAIAGNLDTIAGEVEAEWHAPDGFVAQWSRPAADNPLYRSETEAVTELMEVFITGLELVRDVRLRGFVGASASVDRPRSAIFWRSGLTVRSIAGNLAGMKRLFDASRLAEALPAGDQWLAQSANAQFANAAATAGAAAAGDPDGLLADTGRRAALERLLLISSSLSDLFGTRISGALGLTVGFSSLDGD